MNIKFLMTQGSPSCKYFTRGFFLLAPTQITHTRFQHVAAFILELSDQIHNYAEHRQCENVNT